MDQNKKIENTRFNMLRQRLPRPTGEDDKSFHYKEDYKVQTSSPKPRTKSKKKKNPKNSLKLVYKIPAKGLLIEM